MTNLSLSLSFYFSSSILPPASLPLSLDIQFGLSDLFFYCLLRVPGWLNCFYSTEQTTQNSFSLSPVISDRVQIDEPIEQSLLAMISLFLLKLSAWKEQILSLLLLFFLFDFFPETSRVLRSSDQCVYTCRSRKDSCTYFDLCCPFLV